MLFRLGAGEHCGIHAGTVRCGNRAQLAVGTIFDHFSQIGQLTFKKERTQDVQLHAVYTYHHHPWLGFGALVLSSQRHGKEAEDSENRSRTLRNHGRPRSVKCRNYTTGEHPAATNRSRGPSRLSRPAAMMTSPEKFYASNIIDSDRLTGGEQTQSIRDWAKVIVLEIQLCADDWQRPDHP